MVERSKGLDHPFMLEEEKNKPNINGDLFIKLGNRALKVTGGPFESAPKGHGTVCMAKEKTGGDIRVPTQDFNVPTEQELIFGLWQALDFFKHGKPFHVGCMGGWGRTGIFLTALVQLSYEMKYEPNPALALRYVRDAYSPRAVENEGQEKFLRDLNLSALASYARHYLD